MINLSYGQFPGTFIDYEIIKNNIMEAVEKIEFVNYSMPGGSQKLRKLFQKKFFHNTTYGSSNFCTSVSTNLSFFILLNHILTKNKIGLFTPIYANFLSQIRSDASRKVVYYKYDDFMAERVGYQALSVSDVCVIVIPNNPTGQIPTMKSLENNLQKLYKKKITCIVDASWLYSVYSNAKKVNLDELIRLTLKYNAILLLGFTKLFGVASIRCSGLIANEKIINNFIKIHDSLAIGCGTIDESLIYSFIKNKLAVNWSKANLFLEKQKNLAVNILNKSQLSLNIVQPEAGIFLYFYVLGLRSAKEVVEKCRDRNLLVYPSAMFEDRDDGFRICYSKSTNEIKTGLGILVSVIKESL